MSKKLVDEQDEQVVDQELDAEGRETSAPRKKVKKKTTTESKTVGIEEAEASVMYYLHAVMLLGGRVLHGMLDFYNNLFGLNPKDKAKIYRNVSQYYLKKGLHQKAIDSLKEWARLERNNPDPHYHLAIALASAGKTKQAILVLDRVLKLDPQHSGAMYRRCKLLLKRKEYAEAIAGLEPLKEINPDNAELYYLLGMGYSRLDKIPEAVAVMKKAVELAPEESKYQQHLGFLLERIGEHQQAAACFSRVMELEEQTEDPDDELDD